MVIDPQEPRMNKRRSETILVLAHFWFFLSGQIEHYAYSKLDAIFDKTLDIPAFLSDFAGKCRGELAIKEGFHACAFFVSFLDGQKGTIAGKFRDTLN